MILTNHLVLLFWFYEFSINTVAWITGLLNLMIIVLLNRLYRHWMGEGCMTWWAVNTRTDYLCMGACICDGTCHIYWIMLCWCWVRKSKLIGLSRDNNNIKKTHQVLFQKWLVENLRLRKCTSLTVFYLDHYHIFVGDLSPEVNDEVLAKAFSAFGSMS